MTTDYTPPSTRMTVNLVLPQRTLEEIYQVLTATPNSNDCPKVHIDHPALPITLKHLHSLHSLIYTGGDDNLFSPINFHHLRITALSPLIPRDRSLHLTIHNIIYALTPPCTTTLDTPHRLQRFLNPHNRMPYLIHIHTTSMNIHDTDSRSQLLCQAHIPNPPD